MLVKIIKYIICIGFLIKTLFKNIQSKFGNGVFAILHKKTDKIPGKVFQIIISQGKLIMYKSNKETKIRKVFIENIHGMDKEKYIKYLDKSMKTMYN